MNKHQKGIITDIICIIFTIFLLLTSIKYHLRGGDGYHIYTGLITSFICFIPFILRRTKVMAFPFWFTMSILFAVFFHGYGSLRSLYDRVIWYDIITHIVSSITVGLCTFYALMVVEKYDNKISFGKNGIALFIILISLTLSIYWEVFELLMDVIYETTMQYSPCDTIGDMVSNSIGGLFVALYMRWFLGTHPDYDVAEEFELHPKLVNFASQYGGQSD